jgi:hypothetical protein
VLFAALLIPPRIARIEAEERLLRSHFGAKYEAYCARTAPRPAPPSVSGSVGPSGAVKLDIRKGIARVSATGQLNGTSGSGSWRLPGLCSGRWTASKRGPVQAAR